MLSSMQQKLDHLCDQLNNINQQAVTKANASFNNNKNTESPSNDAFGGNKVKFIDCGCWHCDQHQDVLAGLTVRNILHDTKFKLFRASVIIN